MGNAIRFQIGSKIDTGFGRRRVGNTLVQPFNNDQNFLGPILQAAGVEKYIFEVVAPWPHSFHASNGQAFRKHAIVSGSKEEFPHLQLLFVLNIVYAAGPMAETFHDSPNPVFLRDDSGGETRIGNHQNLRRGRIGGKHFANDAIGGHDGHALLHSGGGTAVDKNYHAGAARGSSDHTPSDHFRWRARLKSAERFGAVRGREFGGEKLIVQLQTVELNSHLAIFFPHVAQR